MHHASVVRDLDQEANGSTCNSFDFMKGDKEIRDIWIYAFILFLGLMLFVGFIGPYLISHIDIRFYWYNFKSTIYLISKIWFLSKKHKINLNSTYIDYKDCIAFFFSKIHPPIYIIHNFSCDTSYQRPRVNDCFSNSKNFTHHLIKILTQLGKLFLYLLNEINIPS